MNLYWINTTVIVHVIGSCLSVVRLTEANLPLICCVRNWIVHVGSH